jgi:soluble lytic murein transglycosylase-like protein
MTTLARLFPLFFLSVSLYGSKIYSYVNEDGVRVFTNLGASRYSDFPEFQPAEAPSYSADGNFTEVVRSHASRYGIDEDLIHSIIRVESNYNPRAVSVKDCKGLMQLHPDTARRFGVTDVFDPSQNIEGGVKYLHFLIELFDRDLDLVLAAYNAGENAVKRFNGIPPYRETQNYVRKVRSLFSGDLVSTQPPAGRGSHRIHRLVRTDGTVLFTNTPAEELR